MNGCQAVVAIIGPSLGLYQSYHHPHPCEEETPGSEYLNDSDADPNFKPGACHVKRCKEDICTACVRCDILLCYDHFIDDTEPCDNDNLKRHKDGKEHDKKRKIAVEPESLQLKAFQKKP